MKHKAVTLISWSQFQHKLIFAWYGDDTQVSQQYTGRISLIDNHASLGKASINLTSVRESDNGWWEFFGNFESSAKAHFPLRYECRMSYPNRSPQTRNNGSWFHLSVDGGTLLKIPPVNQTVLEYEAAFFHCSVKNTETMFVVRSDEKKLNCQNDFYLLLRLGTKTESFSRRLLIYRLAHWLVVMEVYS